MMEVAHTAVEVGRISKYIPKKQLSQGAAMVIVELLSRTPFHHPAGSDRDSDTIGKCTYKRRRVGLDIASLERGKDLRIIPPLS